MQTGIVKWFNDAKGFGFIKPDAGGDDLFAHFSEVRVEGFKSLQENQRVQFEVKNGPKGLQAANISPVSMPRLALKIQARCVKLAQTSRKKIEISIPRLQSFTSKRTDSRPQGGASKFTGGPTYWDKR